MQSPLAEDLDHVLAATGELWRELRGQRVFLTGGTGFFGKWLVESFCWANDRLQLDARLLVLSRNPQAFSRAMPHLAGRPDLEFLVGDVRDFEFPTVDCSHVIHAATPSTGLPETGEELYLADMILAGALRVLEFARECGAKKLLFTSSGAVYGRQPADVSHVAEDYAGAPDTTDPRTTYGHGKRTAEHFCALYGAATDIEIKIARCFAFVGPHLSQDAHFAIGNFIRDGLRGGPIVIQGDGTPLRSYLYAADLAVWLWTILMRGASLRPYNVGSDQALTIADLAHRVAAAFARPPEVIVKQQPVPGAAPLRYVPSTERARGELGLAVGIGLEDAIRRTVRWSLGGQVRAVPG